LSIHLTFYQKNLRRHEKFHTDEGRRAKKKREKLRVTMKKSGGCPRLDPDRKLPGHPNLIIYNASSERREKTMKEGCKEGKFKRKRPTALIGPCGGDDAEHKWKNTFWPLMRRRKKGQGKKRGKGGNRSGNGGKLVLRQL